MIANILPTLWMGFKRLFFYQNMVMMHIKFIGMANAATCNHICCPYTHPRSLVKRSKHFFSVSNQVADQINWNGAYSTKQEHILVLSHTLDPWVAVKRSKHFNMEHRAPCKHKLCPYTQLQTLDGVNSQNIFSESGHVAYLINGIFPVYWRLYYVTLYYTKLTVRILYR